MARLPRLVVANQPHLVIQHGLDQPPVFMDAQDLAHLMEVLRMGLMEEHVRLHAYAVREHEILLLATPPEPPSLARLMQTLGRRYVVAFNRRHGRTGTLWNGRFSAAAVEPGEPLLAAMAWVEQDCDASGVSSAGHHLGHHRDPLITDAPAYWSLGNTPFAREAAWRERLASGVAEHQAASLRRAARGGWALGSPRFIKAMGSRDRPAAPRAPGRPPRGKHPV